ncbi:MULTISPECIES: Crp/Fnr family transcriptional regulator [Fusobacterium]|uniref:Cyclic nucleotide-binding domain protein n=1 Tax=Fusobacterium equinum TaxID=134605 RepID=A0A133NJN3_9FUSO|nr:MULTISPECIES: Crp/Fnr family transcriptional regulator [Fusobacterium]AVQ17235.1 Crp/Fnr family transcriptional regulator [Fusobacterium gonidiaformans ATCC 25563]EFS28003.1 hypothetical protein FGAG_00324 [Fusobacterium gonidiaformans ATCC 25563]KXA16498.1 cyclic nucleotide-binding domain protein [Fusobacterium equinum]
MEVSLEEIKKIEVFHGITKKSIEKIQKTAEIISLPQNKYLYTDKQNLDYIYFVLSGKVVISKGNEHGESRIIFLLSSGAMINQPFMRNNTSAIECIAFENSRILRITFSDFATILSQDYKLCKNCMIFMENRIRRLYRQLKNSVSINLDKKLAAKLYRLGIEHGSSSQEEGMTKINLNITITCLAKMLGCQRESLSRAMKSLNSRKIVKMIGRSIYVDMEAAKNLFKN